MASLILAGAAYESAAEEAELRWHREHFPSPEVWKGALAAHGLQELEEPERLHRVIKGLPATLDDRSSVWISADLNWVAVSVPERESLPLLILGRPRETRGREKPGKSGKRKSKARAGLLRTPWPRTPASGDWTLAGTGWTGFETVLKSLESLPEPDEVSRVDARSPEFPPEKADSRAIIY